MELQEQILMAQQQGEGGVRTRTLWCSEHRTQSCYDEVACKTCTCRSVVKLAAARREIGRGQ
jgi:hypothetical protein